MEKQHVAYAERRALHSARAPFLSGFAQLLRCRKDLGEFAEVLGGCSEKEFVVCAAWPLQSESPQPENMLEVGEEHLDHLAQRHQDFILLGLGDFAGYLAGVFMLFACDLAGVRIGAALRFRKAGLAGQLQGLILGDVLAGGAAVGIGLIATELLQRLAHGADVLIVLGVPFEVGAAPSAVCAPVRVHMHERGRSRRDRYRSGNWSNKRRMQGPCVPPSVTGRRLQSNRPRGAVLGERGVIRHPVRQIEAAIPAIGEVQMHLFAEPPLRPNAQAIADQKHADQQLGIDRGAAGSCWRTGSDVGGCRTDRRSGRWVAAGDLVERDPRSRPRRTARLAPPASVPTSQSPRIPGKSESAIKLRINKSFSSELAHLVKGCATLQWPLSSQLLNKYCRFWPHSTALCGRFRGAVMPCRLRSASDKQSSSR